ncbi:recombinase zinc beta ribbon domain-containing protein [Wolbachia endosymbiont of Aedes albopictus]|uniref:recombinase zinc beta ribbon domain-containing protein n=1 Tax=Wolbachia endosymbiont of Aedes albopictus TaxID=167957 RepID=UPI000BBB8A44|nr:recombinase zinc beta ribbon domain-containing protein [Wolbachia endosymbiont of Aedes albopictus]UVW83844.1 recombinase zinc beta ribbon domain-containing protein [Wolbachia endosymbiont of Aedes albopictus]
MLRNPAYKGQAAFGKSRKVERRGKSKQRVKISVRNTDEDSWIYIPVPKIVDEGLFNKVQKQLDENRKRARMQRGKETSLLQSLVACQNCDSAYSSVHHRSGEKTHSYYRCGGTICITDGEKKCNNKLVRADMLETAIWEEVKSVLKNPEMIKKEYQRRISENKNELLDERFARRESQLKQSIKELINDYYIQENTSEEKYISKEEFKQAMKKMKERLKEIEGEKKKVIDQKELRQKMNLITNSIKGFYSSVKSELEHLDWQAKRSLIRTLVKEVNIDLDEVNVVFKIKELENPVQNGQNQKMAHYLRGLG